MAYYNGQTGSTTRRASSSGRQSDLLMQQLGTSFSDDSTEDDDKDIFESMGFDANSTTSSAPLTFDESTDTRVGNPRKRRGNGSRLGNSSGQPRQERPHAAGMIQNDAEVARRQQIIQGVASDQMATPRQAGRPAPAVRPNPDAPAPGRPNQAMGQVTGMRLNNQTATSTSEGNGTESLLRNNPLTERIREMRGRRIINPITFVRENGGDLETFGIWLYEYRHLFVALTIIFLAIGMLFNRYISFGAGVAMILVGMWLDRIDDDNDTFLVYICGFVTALLPFVMSA